METKKGIFAEIKELRSRKAEVSEGLDELKAESKEFMNEIEKLKE